VFLGCLAFLLFVEHSLTCSARLVPFAFVIDFEVNSLKLFAIKACILLVSMHARVRVLCQLRLSKQLDSRSSFAFEAQLWIRVSIIQSQLQAK